MTASSPDFYQNNSSQSPSKLDLTSEEFLRAYARFQDHYPAYQQTKILDDLREKEYLRLDKLGHTYLDYTGGGQYAETQIQQHFALLGNNVFGNPHSENLTSLAMTELVHETSKRILAFFNASPDEYTAIFTLNATAALKLVGESYPFHADGIFMLTYDNHNSVNGIREFARAHKSQIIYVPLVPPDLRIDEEQLKSYLAQAKPGTHNLFAYPAQSNFSGVQHPLEWIAMAQAQGWDVLLDAAAFVPTNELDLSIYKPDFVSMSFYKIFGYPTGVGCLIARKSSLQKLKRPWYAGGTLTFASVAADDYYLTPGSEGFEDGTVNYLNIPAVKIGLDYIDYIGVDTIHLRVACLTGWLINALSQIKHDNGKPLARIYGPLTTNMRGGTVQFNFFDPDEILIDGYSIESIANREKISIRTGCHCNPGAREIALGIGREELLSCFVDKERMTYEQFLMIIDAKSTGAMRVSMGVASNFADVYRFVQFAKGFVNQPAKAIVNL